jgi:putative transcriptional regulator
MKMSKTYKSDAFAAIHETAQGMFDAGLMTKQTMRQFDETCLTPIQPFSADDVRALREQEEVSQAVLANYLNVTTDYISKLERGLKSASGGTLKLLLLAKRKGLAAIA